MILNSLSDKITCGSIISWLHRMAADLDVTVFLKGLLLLMGRKESNQTNKQKGYCREFFKNLCTIAQCNIECTYYGQQEDLYNLISR